MGEGVVGWIEMVTGRELVGGEDHDGVEGDCWRGRGVDT